MSKPFVLGKFKPKLVYHGLSIEDASKVIDYYISNRYSDKFSEEGIIDPFYARMDMEIDGDEYYTEPTGSYTVQFKSYIYKGPEDFYKEQPWKGILDQLEKLHKLIKDELGIE